MITGLFSSEGLKELRARDPLIRFLLKAIPNLGYIRTELKEEKSFARPWMPLIRQFAGARGSPILMALMQDFGPSACKYGPHTCLQSVRNSFTVDCQDFVYCADKQDQYCAKATLLPIVAVHLTEANTEIATRLLIPLFRVVYPDVRFLDLIRLCLLEKEHRVCKAPDVWKQIQMSNRRYDVVEPVFQDEDEDVPELVVVCRKKPRLFE